MELANAALDLKEVYRSGWIKAGVKEGETVAEHSYGASIIAMALSDMEGLDTERVIKMTLLHDMAEGIVGDITPDQIPRAKKKKHTQKAMDEILERLPEKLQNQYREIWNEYVEAKTPESILVHDSDKIDMLLESKRYKDAKPDVLNDIRQYAKAEISSKRAGIISDISF